MSGLVLDRVDTGGVIGTLEGRQGCLRTSCTNIISGQTGSPIITKLQAESFNSRAYFPPSLPPSPPPPLSPPPPFSLRTAVVPFSRRYFKLLDGDRSLGSFLPLLPSLAVFPGRLILEPLPLENFEPRRRPRNVCGWPIGGDEPRISLVFFSS